MTLFSIFLETFDIHLEAIRKFQQQEWIKRSLAHERLFYYYFEKTRFQLNSLQKIISWTWLFYILILVEIHKNVLFMEKYLNNEIFLWVLDPVLIYLKWNDYALDTLSFYDYFFLDMEVMWLFVMWIFYIFNRFTLFYQVLYNNKFTKFLKEYKEYHLDLDDLLIDRGVWDFEEVFEGFSLEDRIFYMNRFNKDIIRARKIFLYQNATYLEYVDIIFTHLGFSLSHPKSFNSDLTELDDFYHVDQVFDTDNEIENEYDYD